MNQGKKTNKTLIAVLVVVVLLAVGVFAYIAAQNNQQDVVETEQVEGVDSTTGDDVIVDEEQVVDPETDNVVGEGVVVEELPGSDGAGETPSEE